MASNGSDEPKGLAAWRSLLESNKDFVNGVGKELVSEVTPQRRKDLVAYGQHPQAVVVCCADSRCPPEVLFQQTLGCVFVVRCAGNVVADFGTIGSVEYAVAALKAPLVVVLGHTMCGAVTAGLNGLDGELPGDETAALKKLVQFIGETCQKVKDENPDTAKPEMLKCCIEANVRKSVEVLRESQTLNAHVEDGRCVIVPAVYDLESGLVSEI